MLIETVPISISKDVFEPSYELKFMIQNRKKKKKKKRNYVCINLLILPTLMCEPLKVIHEGWNNFQTPVHVDILTSFHESQMFLMVSRMVSPFHKLFNLLCPDPSEQLPSMAAIAL